jgi:hypothetical protein
MVTVLGDRIEIGRRDAAFDDLQPVLRHHGERVGGGIEILGLHPDAGLPEIALLDRDHGGGRRQRPRHADPHGLLGRPRVADEARRPERQDQHPTLQWHYPLSARP